MRHTIDDIINDVSINVQSFQLFFEMISREQIIRNVICRNA
jgi:hypothetical protein